MSISDRTIGQLCSSDEAYLRSFMAGLPESVAFRRLFNLDDLNDRRSRVTGPAEAGNPSDRIRGSLAAKDLTEEEIKRFEHQFESLSPESQSHAIAQLVFDMAAELLPAEELHRVQKIAVRVTYTGTLNALTILLPSGTTAIVIDQAAVWFTRGVVRGIRGLFDCHVRSDFKYEKFYTAMIAHFMVANRNASEANIQTASIFQSAFFRIERDLVDDVLGASIPQQFLLLHEVAHLLLGHRRVDNEHLKTLASETAGSALPTNWGDVSLELEADEFAAECFTRRRTVKGYAAFMQDWIYLYAVVRALDLSSSQTRELDGYPSWSTRWEHISMVAMEACENDDEIISIRECLEVVEYGLTTASGLITEGHLHATPEAHGFV